MPASTLTILGGLGTFLLHSTLWIGGAWLLAYRVRAPHWRARVWKASVLGALASSVLVLAVGGSSLAWHLPRPSGLPSGALATPRVTASIEPDLAATPPMAGTEEARSARPPLSVGSTLVGLWLLGAAASLARLARAHRVFARDLALRQPVIDGAWRETLARLQRRAGLARAPRLSTLARMPSPIALARGEIVVPERALVTLPPAEREALLAHELAHLVRRDPAWRLALDVLARLLWFQPLLRLASTRVAEAAEPCSDDLALRWTLGELALARCLATVASWNAERSLPVAVGLVERPSRLVERVERLLVPRATPRGQGLLAGLWFTTSLLALGCAGPAVRGASKQPPELAIQLLGGERVSLPPQTLRLGESEALKRAEGDERITRAIDVLDDCPEAGIAFHTRLTDEGPEGLRAVQEHAVTLQLDGSLTCGDMRLQLPGVDDARLLRYHLAEIERVTGTAAEIHLAARSPGAEVRTLLVHLATPPESLRRFLLVTHEEDGTETRLRYGFPEDDRGPVARALQVHIEVGATESGTRCLGYRVDDPSGGASRRTYCADLERVRELLTEAWGRQAGLPVVVDPGPGTIWAEARAVTEAAVAAGFTDISFVDPR
jgi:beta-lactamase regulating signal transducer with metallopeptidase domain